MIQKQISVTDQQAEWIQTKISNGHYGDESEVVRDLIHKEQMRDVEIDAVRDALIQGEESGVSHRTAHQVIADAQMRLKQDGKL